MEAEKLHRWISKDYLKRKMLIYEEREALQTEFIEREVSLLKSGITTQSLESFSQECLTKVFSAIDRWSKY